MGFRLQEIKLEVTYRCPLTCIHFSSDAMPSSSIEMKRKDCLQILEEVVKKSKRTKVIMITGYAMMAVAREAMEKGAFDFIAKPFEPDDLRRVIAKAAKAIGSSIDFDTSTAD